MPLALLATVQTGGYINPWKLLPAIILLLVWLRAMTWMDKDAPDAHLPRELMNMGMMAGLLLGYILFFVLPGFWLSLIALLFFFLADIGAYLGFRAKVVGLKDLKVVLGKEFASITGRNKVRQVVAAAGEVQIMAKGGGALPPPDNEAPERRAYDSAQLLLAKPLRLNSERIDLVAGDPSKVSYLVDGVRYDGAPIDRESSSAMVQYLKGAAGMDLAERRKPQNGMFKVALENRRTEMKIITQGNTAGESMQLMANPKKRHEFKIEALGFSEDQLESLRKMVADGGGVVLLSAPRTQGLTSLSYAVIRAHDAFVYHIHTIERVPELDLEGITQNALAANATGAEEAKQVAWVISQEPDMVMMTSIEDSHSAADLAKFATGENHRAYISLRAPSAFDAMRQWRKLVGNDELAMKSLKMVISGRLVRKLCSACKVGYAPDPAQLRKLNMSPDEVGTLYAARKEPLRDAKGNPVPCTFCHDLAFKGRTGVYEMFVIDDEVRKIVAAGGSENQLKQAFRKQRGRFIQDMALAQVKAGETSVEEVLRVLKSDDPPAAGARGSGAAPRPAPAPAAPPPKRPTRSAP